tara:strand:+ start:28 stop:252 length:225 start_codon:yes stop_codon:yes gene_type:complete
MGIRMNPLIHLAHADGFAVRPIRRYPLIVSYWTHKACTSIQFNEFKKKAVLMIPANETQAIYGHISREANGIVS